MNQEHLEDLYDLIDSQRKKINRLIFFFINIIVSYIYIMAGFQTKTFSKHDDYMTPKSAWENIKHLIPKNKVIWEAFYGDGTSGTYLQELGFTRTIHQDIDFFDNNLGDIVVSNPPFQLCKQILTRLKELDKPFILILPSPKLHTQYFRELFGDENLQIIIPRRRIQFKKTINGVIPPGYKSDCNFDCFYYCWKIGLEKDITFLDHAVEMTRKKKV